MNYLNIANTTFNSDGHQYHLNDLSPQIIEHKKKPRHMPMEIQIKTWDRHNM
jgi:hypothetical protein